MNQYHILGQILASHFHQDWPVESGSYESVMREIRHSTSREAIAIAVAEIGDLLGSRRSEEELAAALLNLGCYFAPSSMGLDTREWLVSLRKELRS